ncbi:MAG: uracil-DNA glycosylase [Gammaproteobacteria bacterium]|nr:MAG: uracil-DNA glycosylase [Gammaproteobacteria bacterium]
MSHEPPAAAYDPDCRRCPRLARFLAQTRASHPEYWARPVPSFGAPEPRILIVGLAPGMHGANRTGRPFTGDHAGVLLYQTLYEAGLANRALSASASDGLTLLNARIVNAVKCVPPENKPLLQEIRCCNAYLAAELRQLSTVRVYLALGRVAHDAVLLARGLTRGHYLFAHGREHMLDGEQCMLDSYHCSRYNTSTRRLTPAMFRTVMARACELAGLTVPAALQVP